jgi:hypothetical protein
MVSCGRKKVARKKSATAENVHQSGMELQRGQNGYDCREDGDHPEPAEEDQGRDECDEDDSSEDALHWSC